MKLVRLLAGVLLGLVVISLLVESIEIILVKLVSGQSFSALTDPANQALYFEVRNRTPILILKLIYSFIGGLAGGYIASAISLKLPKTAVALLILIQGIALIWAGFISETLSPTGSTWMWACLLFVIPFGIGLGYLSWKLKK